MAASEKQPAGTPSKKSVAPRKIDEAKLTDLIRDRAYYIWEEKGHPSGQDLEIWLQAKNEILSKNQ